MGVFLTRAVCDFVADPYLVLTPRVVAPEPAGAPILASRSLKAD
jgi:hypothetical protein